MNSLFENVAWLNGLIFRSPCLYFHSLSRLVKILIISAKYLYVYPQLHVNINYIIHLQIYFLETWYLTHTTTNRIIVGGNQRKQGLETDKHVDNQKILSPRSGEETNINRPQSSGIGEGRLGHCDTLACYYPKETTNSITILEFYQIDQGIIVWSCYPLNRLTTAAGTRKNGELRTNFSPKCLTPKKKFSGLVNNSMPVS